MTVMARLKRWAADLKRDIAALWIAARDRRTPIAAKLVAAAVAAYAFSPIDLIPDFIPLLGLVDDLILLPLGILLAVRMIPAPLLESFRAAATERASTRTSRAGAIVVVGIWVVLGLLAWRWVSGSG